MVFFNREPLARDRMGAIARMRWDKPHPLPFAKGEGSFGGNCGLGQAPPSTPSSLRKGKGVYKKSVPAVARRGQLAGHRPSPLCPHDAGRCRRVLSGLQIKRRCKVTVFGATICGLFWFICQQNRNFHFCGHGHKY